MALYVEQKTLSLAQGQDIFAKLQNQTTMRVLFLIRASGKGITNAALIEILQAPAYQVTASYAGLEKMGIVKVVKQARKHFYYVSEDVAGQLDSIMAPFAGDETLEKDLNRLYHLLDLGQLTEETVHGKEGCVHTAKD